jgi:FkbM family methyltransferase
MIVTSNYVEVLDTHFGKVKILKGDRNQGYYYKEHGKHIDHAHIDRLKKIIENKEEPVILDVGCNIGWFSLELKAVNTSSKVIAFEPQTALCNIFADSVELNNFKDITIHNVAIGNHNDSINVPVFDYSLPSNYGGVEIDPQKENKEYIGQIPIRYEKIPLRTLDSFSFDKIDLLKIDVESMEDKVLLGAIKTIKKHKPVIFIEFLKSDVGALKTQIQYLNYEIRETLTENFLCFPLLDAND